MKKLIFRVILPAIIVAAGIACAGILKLSSGKADRAMPEPAVPTVQAQAVKSADQATLVHATGVVEAARQVVISPQVGGKLVRVSPELRPGGRFAQGQALAQIDTRDYKAQVANAEASLRQAELELQLEEGRQETARREWALLGDGRPDDQAALALRKPHLEVARQRVAAAQAGLTKAKADLGRTALVAPFNALVLGENVDLGQVVGAGTQVATLVGTDRFRVAVSVPVDQLSAIEIPTNTTSRGSIATITQRLNDGTNLQRSGWVEGLSGMLDPQTRTASVLISIDDPLGSEGLPLLPGAYVEVEIQGPPMPASAQVPREALHNGAQVWVVDADDRLTRKDVQVGWGDAESVTVTAGLSPGERVVTSPLASPVQGQAVHVAAAQ